MSDISKVKLEDNTYNIKDETARQNIATINSDIQSINNSMLTEMVVFGDSWSDPTVPEADWPNSVSLQLKLNLHNYAINGAGFVLPSNNLISSQITTATNDTSYEKTKVKYVIILGGINDYRNNVSNNDLLSAIVSAVTSSRTLYPNAKVLYVNNFQYPYTKAQSEYWYLLQLHLTTSNICTLNQDGYFRIDFFLSNMFHLSVAGQRLMANNIIAAIDGGQVVNEGVVIKFPDSPNSYIRIARDNNRLIYTIYLTGLDTSVTSQNLALDGVMCWPEVISYINSQLVTAILGYGTAIGDYSSNNTVLVVAKSIANIPVINFNGVANFNIDG